MKLKEFIQDLEEYLPLLLEVGDQDLEVIFETREEWKHYHLSPGLAKRSQHGKTPVLVLRLP